MKIKNSSYITRVFIPVAILLSLVAIAGLFVKQSIELAATLQLGLQGVSTLRAVSALVNILFVVSFILMFGRYPLQKWVSGAFAMLASLLLLIAFTLLPSPAQLMESAPSSENSFALLLQHWNLSLAYIIGTILNAGLFSVLLWGLLNQITNLSEATRFYIPLVLLATAGSIPFNSTSTLLRQSGQVEVSLLPHILMVTAAVLLLLSYFLLRWTIRRIPEERWQADDSTEASMPIFSLAVLFAGVDIALVFLSLVLKEQGNIHPEILLGGILALGVLCILTGPLLLKKSGWRITALIAPVVALFLCALFAVSSWSPEWSSALLSAVPGLALGLLWPLTQMVYLTISKANRFAAKCWAELLVVPLLGYAAALTPLSVRMIYTGITKESFTYTRGYFLALAALVLIGVVAVIYRISKRFQATTSKPAGPRGFQGSV